jgi:hypothetical protein
MAHIPVNPVMRLEQTREHLSVCRFDIKRINRTERIISGDITLKEGWCHGIVLRLQDVVLEKIIQPNHIFPRYTRHRSNPLASPERLRRIG